MTTPNAQETIAAAAAEAAAAYDHTDVVEESAEEQAAPAPKTPPVAPASKSPQAGESRGTSKPAAPPATPPAPTHSKRLVSQARAYGVSEATINKLPSDALEDLVFDLLEQERAASRDASRTGALRAAVERPPSSPAAGQSSAPAPREGNPPTDPDDEIDWGEYEEDGVKKKVDGSEIAPGIVNAFKAMQKQLKAVTSQLTAAQQRELQREMAGTFDSIDAVFAKFGGPFGDGNRHTIKAGSLEANLRNLYLQHLQANPPESGTPAEALEALIISRGHAPRAAGAESPHPAPSKKLPPRSEVNGQFVKPTPEEEWAAAGAARPTQRKPAIPKGTRAAEKAASDWMTEHGYDEDPDPKANGALDGFLE